MQNKKAEKEFFDSFVHKGEYDVFDEKGYNRIVHEIKRLLPKANGKRTRLLDIGCGTGAFTKRLTDEINDVYGLDISSKSVALAQKGELNCAFVTGDAENLQFIKGSFDAIIFSGVLHHLPSMEEALIECYHTLVPGGCFIGFDPNGLNPAMWLYRSSKSPLATRKGWTENERLLYRDTIFNALERAAFKNVEVKGISGVSYKYIGTRHAMKVLKFYNFFDRCLESIGLGHKYGSFLISYGMK